jgi:hypothetical protein
MALQLVALWLLSTMQWLRCGRINQDEAGAMAAMDLTEPQQAILDAIVVSRKTIRVTWPGWRSPDGDVPEVLSLRDVGIAMVCLGNLLLAGHRIETVEQLEGLGLVERWVPRDLETAGILRAWAPPGGTGLTLTAWGASQTGVVLDEHIEIVESRVRVRDPETGLQEIEIVVQAVETPEWVTQVRERPESVRRFGRERQLPNPDLVVAKPTAEPEYLMDLETGETTTDPEKAIKVFGQILRSVPGLRGKGVPGQGVPRRRRRRRR